MVLFSKGKCLVMNESRKKLISGVRTLDNCGLGEVMVGVGAGCGLGEGMVAVGDGCRNGCGVDEGMVRLADACGVDGEG